MELLLFGIAGEFQYFHTVAQSRWYRLQSVGCRDKHHPGQVKSEVQVVIAEVIVLFRVQNFQQSRGRITAPVGSNFIDLVQHNHRVIGLYTAQRLDNAPWHCSYVGAAMTTDLGLIANAAKGHARKLSTEGPGN